MTSPFDINPLVLAAIPITIGLHAVAKLYITDRYVPLVTLGIGIALVALTGIAWQAVILQGIIVGLSAIGLYSGTVATFAPPSNQVQPSGDVV